MPIKIKNWKLALLALVFFCLLFSLGCWQLSRANQKKIMLRDFAARTQQAPLNAQTLSKQTDLRFYRATLTGQFDNQHTLLLDNKISHGKVGYQVYTPFKADGINTLILIDRGFIAAGANRNQLPIIPTIDGHVTITGLLNLPPTYVTLGKLYDSQTVQWPLRIEFIHLPEIVKLLDSTLFPYTLSLAKDSQSAADSRALFIEWQIITMSPEKHIGYAVQWFALALTLLIIFIALNRK